MVDYCVQNRVAVIRLNRPEKLNAFRNEDIEALAETLRRFDDDDSADVGVIHGAGKAFSAGADVKERLAAVANKSSDARTLPSERPAILECRNWKPLVAAVHGHVIGHALGLALLCDFVVAGADARFQLPEVVMGAPSGVFWAQIAVAAGERFATDVILTARRFTAEEAFSAGLISRVAPEGEHLVAATELAKGLVAHPQSAVCETVRLRRGQLVEQLTRARVMGSGLRWDTSPAFQNAVRESGG